MDIIKYNFDKIQEQAKTDGVKIELLISSSENLSLGYSQKKLEKFESSLTQVAGFRVILGGAQGYSYTENLSPEALLLCYREALENAKTLSSPEKNDHIPLVSPEPVSKSKDSKDKVTFIFSNLLYDENNSIEEKMEVARRLEQDCLDRDARIQSVPYANFSETLSRIRVLNSHGMDQEFSQNYFSGYSYPLAKEGASSKMNGDSFFVRRFKDLDVAAIAKSAVEKTVSLLGAVKLQTGNYAVLIDKDEFRSVIGMFTGYLSAKEVFEEKSLFAGKLGQKIASPLFELIDDPLNTFGASARPFDAEGSPSQKTVVFQDGILKNFFTNSEFAQKMNLPHTAHASRRPASQMDIAPSNLIVGLGSKSSAELLASKQKIVYITHFSGGLHSGFKESTGDFSMPAEGLLYENGKCLGPVDQFVVSGNILELLRDIEALGNEYSKSASSIMCPDVLVSSLSFAGA